MKKYDFLRFIILLSLFTFSVISVYSAIVNKPDESRTPYNISMSSGDRILIIQAGAKVYTRVSPTSARALDLKLKEGETLSGQLILIR